MKNLLSILIIGVFTAFYTFIIYGNDGVSVDVDGVKSSYSAKWNTKHDRLLVEEEFIKEYFGADVKTEASSVDVIKNGHILHFETGNEFYVMDNLGGRKIGDNVKIVKGKVYIPLRYICEAFGASAYYNSKTNIASVTRNSNALMIDDNLKPYLENVRVYDQSTIKITGEKTIYFDPRRIMGEPHDADIIFITHTHNDHYEIESIKKVMNENTKIFITADGAEQAKADGLVNVGAVTPNLQSEEQGITFRTIAAYNTAEDRQNHKAEYNWVSYIVKINGYTYYSAGDTDFIPEMKTLNGQVDVAFLPIDGKYNMAAEEAAQAANAINPKIAVPYHYNNFIIEDKTQDFASKLNENIKCGVLTFKMQ